MLVDTVMLLQGAGAVKIVVNGPSRRSAGVVISGGKSRLDDLKRRGEEIKAAVNERKTGVREDS